MTPETSSGEGGTYLSSGNYEATAKALVEIILPAFDTVSDRLREEGFEYGTVKTEQRFAENTAVIHIKPRKGSASTLTFKHHPSKGGFDVKTVTKSPDRVTIKSATKVVFKSASNSKTDHIPEADLKKPILEKAISDFVKTVIKLNKPAADELAPMKVGDPTMPRFTGAQRGKILTAIRELSSHTLKDPSKRPTLRESYKNTDNFYNTDALMDVRRIYWELYIMQAMADSVPDNKRKTPAQRKTAAKKLKTTLGKIPTMADMLAAYPLVKSLDDEICQMLDADLRVLAG